MVVNGAYRGSKAILKSLDAKNFCVTIVIDSVTLQLQITKICISISTDL